LQKKGGDNTHKNERVTIKDVAERAGVSLSTASLVLNGKGGVSDITKEKILKATKELSYRPNHAARSLRASNTKMIGLLIPDILNSFYSEIIEYVRGEIERQGYFLILGITGNKSENEEKYISEFVYRGVDGVICVPQLTYVQNTSYINLLDDYNIPYIFLADNYEKNESPYVMCDLYKGNFDMADYLLQLGMRKLFLLVGDKRVDMPYIQGYRDAFKKNKLHPDDSCIYETAYEFESIQSVAEVMIRENPEAIMTISDWMACATMQEAIKHGIKIPSELSVTGYDDVIYSRINQTPITTVRQPIQEMCTIAVRGLMSMIRSSIKPEPIILEPKLVIRESTKY